MKLFIIFLLIFFNQISAHSDAIYNIIKIPNLEVYNLKSDNGLRYLYAKKNFQIGINKNIVCDSLNKSLIDKKYKIIREELGKYNYTFLKEINLKYIVLCKNLSISKINTGGITDFKNRTFIIDTNFNDKHFRRMIHHEIFHLLENNFINYFNYNDWKLFNYKDFKYAKCSTCTSLLGLDLIQNSNGFLTEYSMSTASEDMAEMYSFLMINFENISKKIKQDEILLKKQDYILKKLKKIDGSPTIK